MIFDRSKRSGVQLLRGRKVVLQLGQNVVDFRSLRHRMNLRVIRDFELMVLTERSKHLQHLRIFILRQQVYLQL